MTKRLDVIIDIETLDTAVTAKIIGIGAVALVDYTLPRGALNEPDQTPVELVDDTKFHRAIHPIRCGNVDRTESEVTMRWWSQQYPRLTELYGLQTKSKPCFELEDSLLEFSAWVEDQAALHNTMDVKVWGNGSVFDVSILEHAYLQQKRREVIPWAFWNIRDVRTLLDVANVNKRDLDFIGVEHYALHDARHEARLVELAFKKLGITQ